MVNMSPETTSLSPHERAAQEYTEHNFERLMGQVERAFFNAYRTKSTAKQEAQKYKAEIRKSFESGLVQEFNLEEAKANKSTSKIKPRVNYDALASKFQEAFCVTLESTLRCGTSTDLAIEYSRYPYRYPSGYVRSAIRQYHVENKYTTTDLEPERREIVDGIIKKLIAGDVELIRKIEDNIHNNNDEDYHLPEVDHRVDDTLETLEKLNQRADIKDAPAKVVHEGPVPVTPGTQGPAKQKERTSEEHDKDRVKASKALVKAFGDGSGVTKSTLDGFKQRLASYNKEKEKQYLSGYFSENELEKLNPPTKLAVFHHKRIYSTEHIKDPITRITNLKEGIVAAREVGILLEEFEEYEAYCKTASVKLLMGAFIDNDRPHSEQIGDFARRYDLMDKLGYDVVGIATSPGPQITAQNYLKRVVRELNSSPSAIESKRADFKYSERFLRDRQFTTKEFGKSLAAKLK